MKLQVRNIDWEKINLVIFDLDGTLYDQSKLRTIMFIKLLKYYILRPKRYAEIKVLFHFRKEREKLAFMDQDNLSNLQYVRCQQMVNVPLQRIIKIVDKWIRDFPLPHLRRCAYPGIFTFFFELKKSNIKIAILSDYTADKKMEALGLHADVVLSAEDAQIQRLKPHPKGLNHIVKTLDMKKENVLYIGDRMKIDGLCAERAGVDYIILNSQLAPGIYKSMTDGLRKR